MRVPDALDVARSSFAASALVSAVCAGDHCNVSRNARAPRAVAGATESAPISFGRSSENPTKKPTFPPHAADGMTTSVASTTAATTVRRTTRTPLASDPTPQYGRLSVVAFVAD